MYFCGCNLDLCCFAEQRTSEWSIKKVATDPVTVMIHSNEYLSYNLYVDLSENRSVRVTELLAFPTSDLGIESRWCS